MKQSKDVMRANQLEMNSNKSIAWDCPTFDNVDSSQMSIIYLFSEYSILNCIWALE